MSQSQDSTPGWGIYGQRYDAAGNAVGSEILIREDPYSSVEHPQVTGLKDGGWIAVWTVQQNSNGLVKIESQRFDSDGLAIDGINTIFQSYGPWPDWPQVTALSDGGWIIIGGNMGQGQRYNANGDFVSYVTKPLENYAMSMAILADGGWIVTYSVASDGSGNGVSGQRYDSSGNAIGSEFRINTYTNNDQFNPVVSSLNDGGWVVVWESNGQDGSYLGIYGQIYNSSGNKVGVPRQHLWPSFEVVI